MPIQFFSGHQDDVFIPALLVLLIGVTIVVLPVMFAPRVARMRQRRAIVALAAVVAVATVVVVAVLAVPGFGTISRQVTALRSAVQSRYGVALTRDEASDLVDGDTLKLPGVALVHDANGKVVIVDGKAQQNSVHLVPSGTSAAHDYILTSKGVELPRKD